MNKPVIFLAFAQDRVEGGTYLRNLPIEQDGIRKALQKARQVGLCEVVERSNTTVENILDVFQEYQDRIAIFHYGGHADSYELLLESLTGEHAMAHSEGLVSFLVKQKGLQLVFLNGCCSQQQALDLTEAGVPAVIGTAQKIDDEVATNLSGRFYKGLAAGLSIDRAWAEAVDQIKVEKGTGNTRALHWKGKVEASDRFPWEIYYRQGAEIVKDWNLPEAVENPLFGLPEIPKTYDLPETPFLFLKRYERQHAEIFFGRSYYIRDLYNRVSDPNSPPVILLYGQSGVGKSSLFDAGLNPRLEKDYKVIYIRRIQEKGLAGTLEYALAQEPAALSEPLHDFPKAPEKPAAELPETLRHLEAAAENASEVLKQEIESLIQRLQSSQKPETSNEQRARKEPPEGGTTKQQPATSEQRPATDDPKQITGNVLLSRWQTIEAQSGKPLIVILDQVEELYTRPNKELPDELAVFLLALRSIFGLPAQRPLGRLILGYRKEYHPEIEAGFKTFLLPRATVFLEPLRRKDILEVFRGVSQTSALKQSYNLSVEDNLPVIIADDLLEDKESPVAPVLQILLTKMWNAAKQENPQAPRLTIEQYQRLKKGGIAMGEFFAQQMEQLRTWQPEVVNSGLALDVLHFHTTALGTAGTRSLNELREMYQHRQDIITNLVGKCKELYLLTEAQQSAEHTSLTHDTLAPVVNNEYNSSDKPGQRAARILNSKMADFDENGSVVWLDEADLAIVEAGNWGMRMLSAKEEQLLEASRHKRRQRQRLRKQLWAGGIVMLLGIVASAIFAFVKMREAKTQLAMTRREQMQGLIYLSTITAPVNTITALKYALKAYTDYHDVDTANTAEKNFLELYNNNDIIIKNTVSTGGTLSPGGKYINAGLGQLYFLSPKRQLFFNAHNEASFSLDDEIAVVNAADEIRIYHLPDTLLIYRFPVKDSIAYATFDTFNQFVFLSNQPVDYNDTGKTRIRVFDRETYKIIADVKVPGSFIVKGYNKTNGGVLLLQKSDEKNEDSYLWHIADGRLQQISVNNKAECLLVQHSFTGEGLVLEQSVTATENTDLLKGTNYHFRFRLRDTGGKILEDSVFVYNDIFKLGKKAVYTSTFDGQLVFGIKGYLGTSFFLNTGTRPFQRSEGFTLNPLSLTKKTIYEFVKLISDKYLLAVGIDDKNDEYTITVFKLTNPGIEIILNKVSKDHACGNIEDDYFMKCLQISYCAATKFLTVYERGEGLCTQYYLDKRPFHSAQELMDSITEKKLFATIWDE